MSERREMLFRGKRIDNSEWITGSLFTLGTNHKYAGISPDGTWRGVVPSTVGQYIGLQDKNEKRIFEGDIVTIDGGDGYFLVKWDPDTARFEMSGDGLVVDFDNFYPHEFEIAGNIHDNPELLEESQ